MDPPKVPNNILAHDRPLLQHAVQTCDEQKFIIPINLHTGNRKLLSKIPVTLYVLIHSFYIQIFPLVEPFEDSIISKAEQKLVIARESHALDSPVVDFPIVLDQALGLY